MCSIQTKQPKNFCLQLMFHVFFILLLLGSSLCVELLQGTSELPYTDSNIDFLDSCDENDADRRPKAIALDCEMVGGGSDGSLEVCARVCLVDEDENLILHTYVKPRLPVTNYRYFILAHMVVFPYCQNGKLDED